MEYEDNEADGGTSSEESELADRVRALQEEAEADEEAGRSRGSAGRVFDESTDSEAELRAYARDAAANDEGAEEADELDEDEGDAYGEELREGTAAQTAEAEDPNWLVRRYDDSPTNPPSVRNTTFYNV